MVSNLLHTMQRYCWRWTTFLFSFFVSSSNPRWRWACLGRHLKVHQTLPLLQEIYLVIAVHLHLSFYLLLVLFSRLLHCLMESECLMETTSWTSIWCFWSGLWFAPHFWLTLINRQQRNFAVRFLKLIIHKHLAVSWCLFQGTIAITRTECCTEDKNINLAINNCIANVTIFSA